MTEIHTVTTLRSKRAEIISSIASYEKRIAQARADLSHVNACIALFEVSVDPGSVPPYVDTHRLFARGELMKLRKDALASGPNRRHLCGASAPSQSEPAQGRAQTVREPPDVK